MRSNLRRHPKVVRMSSALNADRLRVVGGLHAVWCLFDEHSEDGCLCGYTPAAIDDEIGWAGFCAQLIAIGWIESDGADGLLLPEFDTHNGASAKRRAQEADRKRADRAASKDHQQDVLETSASEADKKRTREEKRREEKKDIAPSGFAEFWQEYPNHTAKANALKAWGKVPAELHPTIMAAVVVQKRSAAWTKDNGQFVPHAATWLNGKRWEDQQPANAASTSLFAGAL